VTGKTRVPPHTIVGLIGALLIAGAGALVAVNLPYLAALVEPAPGDFAVTVAPAELLRPFATVEAQAGATRAPAVVLPALDAATPAPEVRPLPTRPPAEVAPPPARPTGALGPAAGEPDSPREPAVDRRRLTTAMPDRLVIPAIRLDVPVTQSVWVSIPELNAGYFDAPPLRAVGWQPTSAKIGEPGNLVMSGHNNILGRVFENVKDLKAGDLIHVRAGRREITYRVTERKLLVEKDQSLDVRTENARYILPGGDDRLTLVTCWPPDNNTHRIIIIARPVAETLDAQR
jgi:LPXTG-site transpeptidase (sortase) family protein